MFGICDMSILRDGAARLLRMRKAFSPQPHAEERSVSKHEERSVSKHEERSVSKHEERKDNDPWTG